MRAHGTDAEEKRSRYFDIAFIQMSLLNDLIQDLTDVVRVQSGQLPIQREHIDLVQVIAEAVELARPLVQGQDVRLGAPTEPLRMSGDRRRLQQVLLNLIANALQYGSSPRGVDVRVRGEGEQVVIEVTDYGSGIPAEHRERVFERFYRAGDSAGRQGLGIGPFPGEGRRHRTRGHDRAGFRPGAGQHVHHSSAFRAGASMSEAHRGHDIVVVGASAGGVEALMRLVGGLPREFAAAVFVVLHIPAEAPSALAAILQRWGPLPVMQGEDAQPIEHGHIYVARPNRHLIVHRGRIAVGAGPRENSARPSIDVLFRSAARAYGRRVVGVVLSGTLHDGALGLSAIKMRGGMAIVQDPDEALFRGMPDSALKSAVVDFCLPAAEIPAQLVELTKSGFEQEPMDTSDREESAPTEHAADEPDAPLSPKLPNAASGITCPECHGSLWELKDGKSFRYECRVGHTYGPDALLSEQGEAVEAALWSAINSLQERASTFRRLQTSANIGTVSAYAERAELTERHAATLHDLLRRLIDDYDVG